MKRNWLPAFATALALGFFAARLLAQEGKPLADGASFTLTDTSVPPTSADEEDIVRTASLLLGSTCETKGDSCGCESGKSCESCGTCDPCEPWKLFGNHGRIDIGGWMEGGVTWNNNNNRGATGNFPVAFNTISDGFVLNQLWGYIGREADTGGCGVDWGFRADYVFGTDANDTQAFGDFGWDFGWDTSRDYGSALPQLYGELAYNDLSVIFGHFYSIIGYEVVQAPSNFFYSHALTFVYGEPFTHTGVLASYDASDDLTLYAGWTTSWDSGFDNRFDGNTFLGGTAMQLTEDASLTWAVNAGNFGDGTQNPLFIGNVYMQSIVLDWNVSDRLEYVFQTDLGLNFDVPNNADNQWYGVNQYLFYSINDCWRIGGRFEWFRDEDGTRVGGGRGNYFAGTAGLNWMPRANINVRPEVRFDWFSGDGQPYNNGNSVDLTTYGLDVIFTF